MASDLSALTALLTLLPERLGGNSGATMHAVPLVPARAFTNSVPRSTKTSAREEISAGAALVASAISSASGRGFGATG